MSKIINFEYNRHMNVEITVSEVDRNTLRKILDFLDDIENAPKVVGLKVTKVKEETPKTEEKPKPLPERKEIPVEKTKAVKKPEKKER